MPDRFMGTLCINGKETLKPYSLNDTPTPKPTKRQNNKPDTPRN